jgi:hypothetical protein
MIGKLGTPYRVVYAAKFLQTGLTNIVAKVQKPNGAYIGLFPMIELSDPFFIGVYYFTLNLLVTEPEGEYVVSVYEPNINERSLTKVTMLVDFGGAGGGSTILDLDSTDLFGQISTQEIIGTVLSNDTISGVVSNSLILVGQLTTNVLVGVLGSEKNLYGVILEE